MVLRKTCWMGLGLVVATAFFVGCGGSGGNNDQGIVFRATGIFRTLTSDTGTIITCTDPITASQAITDTAGTISLTLTVDYPNRNQSISDPCGGYVGLQNNLSQQSINTQFATVRYEVAGSAVQVPTVPVNIGLTVPPASCKGCTSSGIDGFIYLPLAQQLVSQETITFLNQNSNELPAPPYQMNVFVTVSGQSDQGTNYTSNEIGYTITVVE
jgi:hypothetical protein